MGSFRNIIELPEWRMLAPVPAAAGTGMSICSDLRNDESRSPIIYYFYNINGLYSYNSKNDSWLYLGNPAVTTALAAGATSCYMTRGPRGTLAAGATTTTITLSTALPGNVGVNELANRGDGIGHKIRIIGNAAGSSGKTEERFIISNTGGTTTPTIILDSPLTFTPILNDTYEFLSGRVYMLGASTLTANSCKYYDVATQVVTATATPVGVISTPSVDSSFVALDEQYVPATNVPGEGFLTGSGVGGVAGRALTATAMPPGSLSLTGQAIGGDAGVLQHEYRNFQIRIVYDPTRPTAVGQRRKITGHTAGPSPTYTITPAWTVDPSTDTQYVIENANELLLWTANNTTTYTYVPDAIGGVAGNTWNSGIYGIRPSGQASTACLSFQNFAPTLDAGKNYRHSYVFSFRGNTFTDLHLLDIAGGVTGLWSTVEYGGMSNTTFICGTYDPIYGYFYIEGSVGGIFYRFCPRTMHLEPWTFLRFTQSTSTAGLKMASIVYINGTEKATFIYCIASSLTNFFSILPSTDVSTNLNNDIINLPEWMTLASPITTPVFSGICSDMRNTEVRDPFIYFLGSDKMLSRYNPKTDGWQNLIDTALMTTIADGTCLTYMPHRGPRGTLAGGATTTITLSTPFSVPMAPNELANRGDGIGYKIRIIGNAVGSSGKTEERIVVANTAGTTPTIELDSPLTFAPIVGDAFEFLSGRIYMWGSGAMVAGSFKYYDVITQTINSPAFFGVFLSGSSNLVPLDEQHVPISNVPGEGFLTGTGVGGVAGRALTATAIPGGSLSLTGQAVGGDAGVLQHEYRNFQIRIVYDPARPTAVGQRRKITGHTAGPSPTYTITPAWTVDPSADTQYVIENANELLFFSSAGSNDTYVYVSDAIGVAAADTWTINTTYGSRGGAVGVGVCSFQNFAAVLDSGKTYRHSHVFSFRGNSATLDLLDIAGGATGTWSVIDYGGAGTTFVGGFCSTYDPISCYAYITGSTQFVWRFCPKTRYLEPFEYLRYTQGATAVGNRMTSSIIIDNGQKYCSIYYMSSSVPAFHSIIPLR